MADDVTRQLVWCASGAEPCPLAGKERIMALLSINLDANPHAPVRRFDQRLCPRCQPRLRQHLRMRPHLGQLVTVAIEYLRVQAGVGFTGNQIEWVVDSWSEVLSPCREKLKFLRGCIKFPIRKRHILRQRVTHPRS